MDFKLKWVSRSEVSGGCLYAHFVNFAELDVLNGKWFKMDFIGRPVCIGYPLVDSTWYF